MTRRRVLMVAFHYPPIQGSSGVHRALAFSRYLPEFGWDVSVLTVNARAHENVSRENEGLLPRDVEVVRAHAWDAARHFALFGRYPSSLARPDRWASWRTFGLRAGMRVISAKRVDAIFSTFPIATAHVIAAGLHKRSGLPWVADFRDPMASRTYPHEPLLRSLWARIQDEVVDAASRVTLTTPGTADFYRKMYPNIESGRFSVIENGFDPEALGRLPEPMDAPNRTGRHVLLHSGILYPRERDPSPFLRALRRLLDRRPALRDQVLVRFRASGFDDEYRRIAAELGLLDVIEFAPSMPYARALHEMRNASALLLLQGRFCNAQIPAKAYEYLYLGRPILGLTDPEGDTGRLLRRFEVPDIVALEDEAGILQMLELTLPAIFDGQGAVPSRDGIMNISRRAGAAQLAGILDAAIASR